MVYFITASASASVIQTTFDTTGSIVTSSLGTPNNPINVSKITYLQKGSAPFPNLSRPVYKYSVSFLYDGKSISWLYDTTASRDSDFDSIQNLDTKTLTGNSIFVTSSASSSVIQTTFDATGSIVTSSLYVSNNPVNLNDVTYLQKGSAPFPNLSRPVYKPAILFTYTSGNENYTINWLYDTTASRDSDFNIVQNYTAGAGGGGGSASPGGKDTTIQYNDGGSFNGSDNFIFDKLTNTVGITGSLNIQQGVSGNGLTVTGSSILSGSAIINDITYPTMDGDNGDIIYTDGAGVLTFDKTKVYAPVKNVSGGTLYKGTPVHASSSVGNANEVIAASASVASTMPATFVLAQDLADEEEGLGIVTGFLNGVDTSAFKEGQVVYVGENGGYTNVKPSGSNLIQNLGIVTKVAVNGSGYIYGAGRSNDTPNLLHNQIFFGSGSDQQYQIHISGALDSTVINNITASGIISSSNKVTALTGSFGRIEGLSPITVGDPITFEYPITASSNISSSGYISASFFYGDGSGLFNLPESDDLKVYLNFESATSYAYITPYNLQFDSYYTSSTMTLQFSSSGAEYIFGTPLNQYDILSITSSAVGLVTLSGSKL